MSIDWLDNPIYPTVLEGRKNTTLYEAQASGELVSSISRFNKIQCGPNDLALKSSASFWSSDIINASIISAREFVNQDGFGVSTNYSIYANFFACQSRLSINPVHAGIYYGTVSESVERSPVSSPNVSSVALSARCRRADVSLGTLTSQVCLDIRTIFDSGSSTDVTACTGIDLAALRGVTVRGIHIPSGAFLGTTGYGIRIDGDLGTTTAYSLSSFGSATMMVHLGNVRIGAMTDPVNALDVTGGSTISTRMAVGTTTLPSAVILTAAASNAVTATSIANLTQASTGDAGLNFAIGSTTSYTIGIDNSVTGDPFVLAYAAAATAALGTGNVLAITSGGLATLGTATTTTNANMTQGLTINQAGNNNEALALKSSDVAHGVTLVAETDTYASFLKQSAASGGLLIRGYSEVTTGLQLWGLHTTDDTSKSGSSAAAVSVMASLKTSTNHTGLGANANIMTIGYLGATRFIFDAEGDSHEDGTGWTAYDDRDDVEVLDAINDELIRAKNPNAPGLPAQSQKYGRAFIEQERLVAFNDGPGGDGRPFINKSRLMMMVVGAIRQERSKRLAAESRLAALERRP